MRILPLVPLVCDCAPRLRVEAREGPGRSRVLLAVDDERSVALDDEEDLLLLALGLVVLGNPVVGLELDEIHPERAEPE